MVNKGILLHGWWLCTTKPSYTFKTGTSLTGLKPRICPCIILKKMWYSYQDLGTQGLFGTASLHVFQLHFKNSTMEQVHWFLEHTFTAPPKSPKWTRGGLQLHGVGCSNVWWCWVFVRPHGEVPNRRLIKRFSSSSKSMIWIFPPQNKHDLEITRQHF